jgi:hypothetical protein
MITTQSRISDEMEWFFRLYDTGHHAMPVSLMEWEPSCGSIIITHPMYSW